MADSHSTQTQNQADLDFTASDLEIVYRMLIDADSDLGYMQLVGMPINAFIQRVSSTRSWQESGGKGVHSVT